MQQAPKRVDMHLAAPTGSVDNGRDLGSGYKLPVGTVKTRASHSGRSVTREIVRSPGRRTPGADAEGLSGSGSSSWGTWTGLAAEIWSEDAPTPSVSSPLSWGGPRTNRATA